MTAGALIASAVFFYATLIMLISRRRCFLEPEVVLKQKLWTASSDVYKRRRQGRLKTDSRPVHGFPQNF
jgi:hypothetical protein